MSRHPNYVAATNAAYRVLIKQRSFSFTTDVFAIAWQLENCRLFTYGQACALYGFEWDDLIAQSEFGFTILSRCDNARIILYNETKPYYNMRFTIAHEIGHAVLGHSEENQLWEEQEANCFARNLLCPIPTVYAFDLQTDEDYVLTFTVSEQMANISNGKRDLDKLNISHDNWIAVSDMIEAYINGFESVDAFYWYLVS